MNIPERGDCDRGKNICHNYTGIHVHMPDEKDRLAALNQHKTKTDIFMSIVSLSKLTLVEGQ